MAGSTQRYCVYTKQYFNRDEFYAGLDARKKAFDLANKAKPVIEIKEEKLKSSDKFYSKSDKKENK